MTTAQAIPQQKFEVSAQEFYNQLSKKYPSLAVDSTVPILVAQLKEMGLFIEYVSVAALWGAFYAAVSANKLSLPPVEPTLTPEALEKLKNSFPKVIKFVPKEMSQKEKSALAGISDQTGRMTQEDREEQNRKISKGYADQRSEKQRAALRREYLELKTKAEMVMGENPRSHAQRYAARKLALQTLNSSPKYSSVRDPE